MPFSLTVTEQKIIDFIRDTVFPAYDCYEEAVPDIDTLKRDTNNELVPYITFQIGDPQPWGSSSFAGPRGDDYSLPVRWQAVVPEPPMGRAIRGMGIDKFLGASFPWAGNIRKRVSGGQFPLKSSDGAVEAYLYPASFGIVVQMETIT